MRKDIHSRFYIRVSPNYFEVLKRRMESDLYRACRDGDIDFVQTLLETSSNDTDMNCLEPNGSTPLHIACSQGHTNVVRFLLNEYGVQRHRTNKSGKTAYEMTSLEEIRQLFRRPRHDINNPFCTNENTFNPLKVIGNENPSDPRYIDVYPNNSPIISESPSQVVQEHFILSDWLKSLIGIDPHKNKIEKWSQNLQFHIEQCFIEDNKSRKLASQCIKEYKKTKKIEHLLRLHTLDISICQYLSQNCVKTDSLNDPIVFNLLSLYQRAFQGICFRGLTMKTSEFKKYEDTFRLKTGYIKTKTFCSTSISPNVAQMFADHNQTEVDIINVLMIFQFNQSCSTALRLYSISPKLNIISNYPDEQEVLILPNTNFSVTNIEQNSQTQLKIISLEHYNKTEDKFESFIDTNICEQIFNFF
jgi:hypothetical protein